MFITKSHQADPLFRSIGRQKHCHRKPQRHIDVFVGLGSFLGMYNIQLKPGIEPVIHPLRKIPIALRNKLEKGLKRMEGATSHSKSHRAHRLG